MRVNPAYIQRTSMKNIALFYPEWQGFEMQACAARGMKQRRAINNIVLLLFIMLSLFVKWLDEYIKLNLSMVMRHVINCDLIL